MRINAVFILLLITSGCSAQAWNLDPFMGEKGLRFHNDLDFYLNSYSKNQVKTMRKQVNIMKMSFNKVMREQVDEIREFSEGNLNDGKTKDFTLPTTTGEEFSLNGHQGKVRAFMFVSVTNPPAMFQLPKWTDLQAKYDTSEVVLFVIYGRELHPGEKGFRSYKRPTTDAERMILAKELSQKTTLPVAVDGIDGEVQNKYGRIPNAAFVIDRKGDQIFRGTWADAIKIEHILDTLIGKEQEQ